MKLKNLLRGPLLYIIVAVIAVWVGSSLISMTGFQAITTEEGLKYLKDNKVASATIVDVEQRGGQKVRH
jgi:cell division protease FtsH